MQLQRKDKALKKQAKGRQSSYQESTFDFEKWLPYLFISPALVFIAGFLFYPLGNVFYYSLQNYNANTPFYNGFAGLDNFIRILTQDPQFYASLWISGKWVGSQVSLQVIFGMSIALILNQKFKFRTFFRAAAFTPWAISGVLTSVMWSLMYNEHMGVINDLFLKLGVIDYKEAWIADLDTVFPAVVVAELWRGIPFFAITLLSALQSIPDELYEAAKVDGAGRIKTFIHITLPQLKNTLVLTTLLRCVWEYNNVDLIFNLTGGGPAHHTTTLSMYVAELAIRENNFGYGSAITVISFSILLIFVVTYLKISRMERGAEV
ncbi:carbohydrate ABC transporter permease [Pelosinus sp. UFO1]|uniref:carbohydrate ABC transporter permease n=1 Tax=Pelosinus sp. UFO1 TaxID=484770 RepID=UPI0004D11EB9|nr:sugar ABC transporter permease [Pelosinus sp. UFO1]AIF50368.1 ABC-type transporter, integral membrane subunit [Pelosinus sp. UFO1]